MIEKEKEILVIGDVMLDRYIIADHIGTSPEANVPLLHQTKTSDRLGGAGNVAINLLGLKVKPVLISVCGEDKEGFLIRDICTYCGIDAFILSDPSRRTTIKKRIVDADFNQFLRIDHEDRDDLNAELETKFKQTIVDILEKKTIEVIIIQDYNKGCITKSLIKFIQKECKSAKIPLVVDPKSRNFVSLSQCTAFKPNLKELADALGRNISPEISSIKKAIHDLDLDSETHYFVTLADKGIFYMNKEDIGIIKGETVENPDVSGAGDTVLAVVAFGLLAGLNIETISGMANKAGAAVVSKNGVSPVNLEDIGMK